MYYGLWGRSMLHLFFKRLHLYLPWDGYISLALLRIMHLLSSTRRILYVVPIPLRELTPFLKTFISHCPSRSWLLFLSAIYPRGPEYNSSCLRPWGPDSLFKVLLTCLDSLLDVPLHSLSWFPSRGAFPFKSWLTSSRCPCLRGHYPYSKPLLPSRS